MLLHIGKDIMIKSKELVFIIDYENFQNNKTNKRFVKSMIESKKLIDISGGKVKSLILSKCDNSYVVYLSPISSSTLLKRSNSNKVYIEK